MNFHQSSKNGWEMQLLRITFYGKIDQWKKKSIDNTNEIIYTKMMGSG